MTVVATLFRFGNITTSTATKQILTFPAPPICVPPTAGWPLLMPNCLLCPQRQEYLQKRTRNQWLGLDSSTPSESPSRSSIMIRARRPCIAQFAQLQQRTAVGDNFACHGIDRAAKQHSP